ncbi:serine/threonine-protein kinase [Stratiformator vulcanicus]|uniref:non-specific serine/threonine protein kinase n=1 Tax=Stratiformator vulcanicus TaxID=2527980 RepID=A0A517QVZ1_9PLAN|nr:serine/threonine-protein kinase [Stratiformator vulcanicus]QDT35826.1 Serine/threonine-protein kinase StkP [Stratiformator vulcanicus]
MSTDSDEQESSEQVTLQPGMQLGRYLIKKRLGEGGMGTVWLAEDTQLSRSVALKVLKTAKGTPPNLIARFQSEARAAANLKHPSIVSVYDTGEIEGVLFIALEYVEGIDVERLMEKKGPIPYRRTVSIIGQIADALDHLHGQGFVHRDIKPSNILIRKDGSVTLTDLGLARAVEEESESRITRAGHTVGTVDYMPPEQARSSRSADIRSDIYSLGCTWYHMLTGDVPYRADSLTNRLRAHAEEPIPDPRKAQSDTPEAVVAVLRRMMAKKPSDRYQTPSALSKDITKASQRRSSVSVDDLAALSGSDTASADSRDEGPLSDASMGASKISDGALPSRKARPQRRSKSKSSPRVAAAPPPGRRPLKHEMKASGKPTGQDSAIVVAGVVGFILFALVAWWLVIEVGGSYVKLSDEGGEVTNVDPRINEGGPLTGNGSGNGIGNGQQDPAGTQRDSPNGQSGQPTGPEPGGTSPNPTRFPDVGGGTGTNPNQPTVLVPTRPDKTDDPSEAAPTPPPLSIGTEQERPHFPEWVATVATAERPHPWNQPGTEISVGRSDRTSTDYVNLSEAFANLPGTTATIRLHGDGPFVWKLPAARVTAPLTIVAATGSRPVITFVGSEVQGASDALLEIDGAELAFIGVDLTFDLAHAPLNAADVFAVAEGLLALRDTTISVERSDATAVENLVRLRQLDADPEERRPAGRVLFDRCVIDSRGTRLVDVEPLQADVVVSNSVAVLRDAGAFRVPIPSGFDPMSNPGREVEQVEPTLRLALFSSSCFSSESFLRAEPVPGFTVGSQPAMSFRAMNSVAASFRGGESQPLLSLGQASSTYRPENVIRWNTDRFAFGVWKPLIAMDGQTQPIAAGPSSWQRTWNDYTPPLLIPLSSLPRSESDSATPIDKIDQFARVSSHPDVGADPALLPERSERNFVAGLFEAKLPLPVRIPDPSQTINFNLGSGDLGSFVNSGNWPDGARIIASGSGPVPSSSFAIAGRTLTIEFETAGESPPTLRPRLVPESSPPAPFISVRNGRLRLINPNVVMTGSTRRRGPNYFLETADATVLIESGEIRGPERGSLGHVGMFRLRSADANATSFGNSRGTVELRDTFLTAESPVVTIAYESSPLRLTNCGIVTTDDILRLQTTSGTGSMTAMIEHCSLSAGRATALFAGQNVGRSATDTVRVSIRDTVILPPLGIRPPSPPAVIFDQDQTFPTDVVHWRDRHLAVAIDDVRLLAGPGVYLDEQRSETRWRLYAGKFGTSELHLSKDAVRLASRPQIDRVVEIEPRDLKLDPACEAASAGRGGKPLGFTMP